MLTLEGCEVRQRRLRDRLAAEGIDAIVLTDQRDIYYLTGILLCSDPAFTFPAFYILETDGGSWLASHSDEGEALVDDWIVYEWHKLYTLNPDPLRQLDAVVSQRLRDQPTASRIGWQEEALPKCLADTLARTVDPSTWVPVDDLLAELQKRKEPDEVALLKRAIDADLAAYTAAQEAIAPGVNELEVLAAGQRAAMHSAGEVIHHGGDYQCGEFGGPARDRKIEAGELYIIDAHSTYRGYWADLCRTFVVEGEATEIQLSAYEHLTRILEDVPELVRPGGNATELWRTVDARIREHPAFADTGLIHHAGHGVGLRPHEAPDLNRDREGVFEVGDVFSCEPGAYCEELRAGIRLENTFLITESGVENLSEYPLDPIPGGRGPR
ncbi:MAG: Xaa-Pro peptidase family protein [Candidatus Latescibacteria bacterium]|jgi:Xaa-Pro aminopeptidase|nr:Xaa-Pro peptidase family protein [Candidatus Latescibacterota bacterium]